MEFFNTVCVFGLTERSQEIAWTEGNNLTNSFLFSINDGDGQRGPHVFGNTIPNRPKLAEKEYLYNRKYSSFR